MAGGANKIHEHPNAGKGDFRANPQNISKNGRNPSIRKQLKELMQSDGGVTIPAKQVQSINEDGSVTISVPTEMQLAMKLKSWAMSKKGTDSIKAIQMIMEQIDGKPMQENQTTHKIADYTSWSDKWINSNSQESKSE